eukprot:3367164-Pyramimonas_sp.AAC.1
MCRSFPHCLAADLSRLLTSDAHAFMRALWERQGHSSMVEWARAVPFEFITIRRAILYSAAEIERRHGMHLDAPFSLTTLADPRTSQGYKEHVLREFSRTSPCCHRPGMARALRERCEDEDERVDLTGPLWTKYIRMSPLPIHPLE